MVLLFPRHDLAQAIRSPVMSSSDVTEKFVALLAASEHEIYRYVFALVPRTEDARDIAQETAVALWRKFDEYNPAEPFVPWACRFAYFEVLKYRKQQRHQGALVSDEAFAALVAERSACDPILDNRARALSRCLEKISAADRRLLEQRYQSRATVRQMADDTGRNIHTLYKALERIRRWLFECIDQALTAEDRP
jgi:RNA polymerase sigma-70 factor (ECF subfamily)